MKYQVIEAANRPIDSRLGLVLAILLALNSNAYAEVAISDNTPPNVVLILADDLGWADLGCYGNLFNETPQIDQLAREGIRFTQFYAGPVCSPTRANLQSGQDQARFGITQHIPGHRRPFAKLVDPIVPLHLPLQVKTFAERFQDVGYVTGHFGKWHLGNSEFGPERQGWQETIVGKGNESPSNLTGSTESRRTAEFLTEKALDFIERHQSKPFLLQVSHYAVHIPLSTTPDLMAKYKAKMPVPGYPCRPEYAGLLEELDQSVGCIVDAVDRLGLSERTLIVFLSDNGGLEHEQSGRIVTSNKPLRGEKGTLYEGGIRVPAIARWTGRVPANANCDVPALTMDLYPTLMELSATSIPADQPLDGLSLAPLLSDPVATLDRNKLYWHLPHYHHSTPASAMRTGEWKLIEFFEDNRVELFNLRDDPGESIDLSGREPERVNELREELSAWREKVGARMPIPNPDYDPARATELEKGKSSRRKT